MLKSVLGWICFATILNIQPAFAQVFPGDDNNIRYSSELTADLTPPRVFDGLYAGFSIGLANNNFNTFYNSGANTYRVPAGVFVGYNQQIHPWLLAGVELQGDIALDWASGASDFRVMGLGRVGFLAAKDFAIYQMVGLGLINSRPAYAIGLGAEQAFTPNLAMRAEVIAYGQLGAPPGVTNYGGFTLMKIAAGPVWRFNDNPGANAPVIPAAGVPETTDFTGPYVGAYTGLIVNPAYSFFVGETFHGWHLTRFTQGAIAGWNYAITDWARAGIEVQAGINYNTSGGVGWDSQALARLGVLPMDKLMLYSSAGVGILEGRAAYSVGGGVEYALWGKNTVRLDAQMLGEIQPGPPINAPGFAAAKATVGTVWHLQ